MTHSFQQLTQGLSTEVGVHDPKVGFPFDILCGGMLFVVLLDSSLLLLTVTASEEHWMLAAGTAEERTSWLAAIRLNIAIKDASDALVNEVLKVQNVHSTNRKWLLTGCMTHV